MLTKPYAGWTEFSLEGTASYSLSYFDDIAFEWVEQAIHGLETMLPFCVKGFLEPYRVLCVVSYWNCHIIVENDEREPLKPDEVQTEYSHTSMLDFCKYLYQDVSGYVDEWVSFMDVVEKDNKKKRKQLLKMLEKLKGLIEKREERFGLDHCFF